MMFPEAELLGVDIVMPDLTYLEENQEHVRALVLTHGHEDHIGAVPYFLTEIDRPGLRHGVHAGAGGAPAGGARLLDPGQAQHGQARREALETRRRSRSSSSMSRIRSSAAVALAITTPLGVIIHTGDFKVDPTPTDNELFDLHTLADYGKRGVLLLLSDSTNADRPGYTESERAVRPRMEDIFNRAERRVVVSCFSSSIHRIQQFLDLVGGISGARWRSWAAACLGHGDRA